MKLAIAMALIASTTASSLLFAAEEPKPAAKKSLLDIVVKLENDGYGPITDISMEEGDWEVEAYKGDVAYEMLVDAETGEVVAEHRDDGDSKPPANAKKLSEIITMLESEGYSRIREVSFERKNWEVEAIKDKTQRELRVDPVSGKVVSDRVDD